MAKVTVRLSDPRIWGPDDLLILKLIKKIGLKDNTCLSTLECENVTLKATLLPKCVDGGDGNFGEKRFFQQKQSILYFVGNEDFFISSSDSEDLKPDNLDATCRWNDVSNGRDASDAKLEITLGDW